MVYEGEYEEVADADKQNHSKYRKDFVPHSPRRNALMKRSHGKPKHPTTTEGNHSKQERHQQLIALIRIEPKRLQQVHNQENDNKIHQAVPQPVTARCEWISTR